MGGFVDQVGGRRRAGVEVVEDGVDEADAVAQPRYFARRITSSILFPVSRTARFNSSIS